MCPRPAYLLLIYSLCAGALATLGGLLAAAFVPLPVPPVDVWYGATAALTVLCGVLAGPVLWWLEHRRGSR